MLDKTAVSILHEQYAFHDFYLSFLEIRSEKGATRCQIGLSHLGIPYAIHFYGVSSFHVEGDIVFSDAKYPTPEYEPSVAQVLDIWFDCHDELECCILLDSERVLLLTVQNVRIENAELSR